MVNLTSSPLTLLKPLILSPITLKFHQRPWIINESCAELCGFFFWAQILLFPQRTCRRDWSCPHLFATLLCSHKGHVSEIEVVLISLQRWFLFPRRTCLRNWSCPDLFSSWFLPFGITLDNYFFRFAFHIVLSFFHFNN